MASSIAPEMAWPEFCATMHEGAYIDPALIESVEFLERTEAMQRTIAEPNLLYRGREMRELPFLTAPGTPLSRT